MPVCPKPFEWSCTLTRKWPHPNSHCCSRRWSFSICMSFYIYIHIKFDSVRFSCVMVFIVEKHFKRQFITHEHSDRVVIFIPPLPSPLLSLTHPELFLIRGYFFQTYSLFLGTWLSCLCCPVWWCNGDVIRWQYSRWKAIQMCGCAFCWLCQKKKWHLHVYFFSRVTADVRGDFMQHVYETFKRETPGIMTGCCGAPPPEGASPLWLCWRLLSWIQIFFIWFTSL